MIFTQLVALLVVSAPLAMAAPKPTGGNLDTVINLKRFSPLHNFDSHAKRAANINPGRHRRRRRDGSSCLVRSSEAPVADPTFNVESVTTTTQQEQEQEQEATPPPAAEPTPEPEAPSNDQPVVSAPNELAQEYLGKSPPLIKENFSSSCFSDI